MLLKLILSYLNAINLLKNVFFKMCYNSFICPPHLANAKQYMPQSAECLFFCPHASENKMHSNRGAHALQARASKGSSIIFLSLLFNESFLNKS